MDLKKISVFRIKDDTNPEDFLKQFPGSWDKIDAEGVDELHVRYETKNGKSKTENDVAWIRLLNSTFEDPKYKFRSFNKFARGLAAIKTQNEDGRSSWFVLAFGAHGDTFLEREHANHDFGIKCAMNLSDSEAGIKGIQTTAHEAISKQTERQASTGTSLNVFSVNLDAEMIRSIAGKSQTEFNSVIASFTGKDRIAIRFADDIDVSWNVISDVCKVLDERFSSDDYQQTEFRAFDLFRFETDKATISALDDALCSRIENDELDKIHLAPPEFVEDSNVQYAFEDRDGNALPTLFEELQIANVFSVKKRRRAGLSKARLKKWKIFEFFEETDSLFVRWSVYQTIVAEIDLNGSTYVLSNGQWRRISDELRNEINTYFQEHNDFNVQADYLPEDQLIHDPNTGQNKESVYNDAAAEASDELFCFDKAKIDVAGDKRYEMCDLLHLERVLIHAKRYYSGSASISHLFAQAEFYSRAFATEMETRVQMRDFIENNDRDVNAGKNVAAFRDIIPVDHQSVSEPDFLILFCVLHERENFELSNLPFMAKYQLVKSHRYLTQDRRFNVGLVFRRVVKG